MVADMVVDKKMADMELGMMADMQVDKVADKADMVADTLRWTSTSTWKSNLVKELVREVD